MRLPFLTKKSSKVVPSPRTNRYFGRKFYSKYFNSKCVVVDYVNDDNWYFVVATHPHRVLKAQTNFKNTNIRRYENDSNE